MCGVTDGVGEELGARTPKGCSPLPSVWALQNSGWGTYSGGTFDPQERKNGQNYCPESQNYYPAFVGPSPGPLCYLFNPAGTKHCP